MKNTPHIKIWTRSTAPNELWRFATFADDLDTPAENTVIVIHIPQLILEDETFKLSSKSITDWMWLEKHGVGLFGINCIDTHPHPDGDGVYISGSCI